MFEGRTFMCQSAASIEMPSRWETSPSLPNRSLISWSFTATSSTGTLISPVRKYVSRKGRRSSESGLSRFEIELQHEQERDHAGIGLEVVAEVVVARDLAGEDGVLLAHAVLDEGVADAVDQRDAAGALDRLPHRPARADVVDDLRRPGASRA